MWSARQRPWPAAPLHPEARGTGFGFLCGLVIWCMRGWSWFEYVRAVGVSLRAVCGPARRGRTPATLSFFFFFFYGITVSHAGFADSALQIP